MFFMYLLRTNRSSANTKSASLVFISEMAYLFYLTRLKMSFKGIG